MKNWATDNHRNQNQMSHNSIQALGSEVDETSPLSGTKNRIAVSRSVASELEVVEGQQVTVKNLEATDERRGRGHYIGAYQVRNIVDRDDDVVILPEEGRKYLSDNRQFSALVRGQVPDNTLSVEDARRLNEFTETLHIESDDSEVVVLAYHGGDIEANTDESAWWFYKKCKEYGVDADVYTARGYGKASFSRWHVGSSSMHLRSYPYLQEIAKRHYDLAVAFHLHDVDGSDSPKILVGGRVEEELREQTANRLNDELPSKYEYITDRSQHSMMGGSGENLVNWLTRDGESGLQIESTPRNQQIRRKTIGRQVAHAVLNYRDIKKRKRSRESTQTEVLGTTEHVTVIGENESCQVEARVDAGAGRSCIDEDLADRIGVGTKVTMGTFRSANGESEQRPIVELTVDIRGKKHHLEPSVTDRSELSTDFRLGRDVLKDYYIDVTEWI